MGQQDWLVQVVIRASESELADAVERMGEAICPSPEHDGPCVTPWTLVHTPLDDVAEPERSSWRELLADE